MNFQDFKEKQNFVCMLIIIFQSQRLVSQNFLKLCLTSLEVFTLSYIENCVEKPSDNLIISLLLSWGVCIL